MRSSSSSLPPKPADPRTRRAISSARPRPCSSRPVTGTGRPASALSLLASRKARRHPRKASRERARVDPKTGRVSPTLATASSGLTASRAGELRVSCLAPLVRLGRQPQLRDRFRYRNGRNCPRHVNSRAVDSNDLMCSSPDGDRRRLTGGPAACATVQRTAARHATATKMWRAPNADAKGARMGGGAVAARAGGGRNCRPSAGLLPGWPPLRWATFLMSGARDDMRTREPVSKTEGERYAANLDDVPVPGWGHAGPRRPKGGPKRWVQARWLDGSLCGRGDGAIRDRIVRSRRRFPARANHVRDHGRVLATGHGRR